MLDARHRERATRYTLAVCRSLEADSPMKLGSRVFKHLHEHRDSNGHCLSEKPSLEHCLAMASVDVPERPAADTNGTSTNAESENAKAFSQNSQASKDSQTASEYDRPPLRV